MCYNYLDAVAQGANEIDMVINLGDVKNGDLGAVRAEIEAVRAAAGGKLLKEIVHRFKTSPVRRRFCRSRGGFVQGIIPL